MAKVFGSLPLNDAEKKVILALKEQLPADCLVIPSVRWAKKNERGYIRDGEADIVVLVPKLGMLVVEVKGSKEIRVTDQGWARLEDGQWIVLDRTPIEQATSNAYELKRIVCGSQRWGDNFPGLLGWLAVYPNGNASMVPALIEPETLVTRRDMASLKGKVQQALSMRGSDGIASLFTEATQEAVARVLTSSEFRVIPADGAEEVSEDKNSIEKLTQQQFAVLRGLFELPSVAIAGPAGSGKTLLALARLESLLEAGSRAFYACFNKDLAKFIRQRNPALADHIHSVDSMFGKTCPGLSKGSDANEFFRKVLPNQVFDEVSGWSEEKKFDAVLVDEAQDLSEDQLLALNSFVRKGGSWSVFLDRRQDIFKPKSDEDLFVDVVYRLSHNCRNTVQINRSTNAYVGSEIASMPGMPEGVNVAIERIGKGQMANRAFELAKDWQSHGQNSIAILSPYTLDKSSMAGKRIGHGISLTEQLGEIASAGKAYFSTIKSFKGIEADCVIVIDAGAPKADTPFSMEDLYVACTRARTRLAILTDNDEAVHFFQRK